MAVRIIVLTDDPLVLAAVRSGFDAVIDVASAGSALDAMKLMDKSTPDLVIVDLQSGNAGGFSLLKEMAHEKRLAQVPSLMLISRVQDGWLARQSGADDVLLKPLEHADFIMRSLSLIEA